VTEADVKTGTHTFKVDEHSPVLDLFRNRVPVTRTLADAAGRALAPPA
jgi:hypothetical protein